jgi:uncharacterized protein YqgC (DUF456 family)
MEYDLIWSIIGLVVLLAGIVGCLLPIIPGPPLSWASLVILQLHKDPPFTTDFLILWAVVVILVSLLDYYVPVWGTKKFGGTKYGAWGSAIGIIFGIFLFPPFGIIIGPFVGALAGETIAGKDIQKALKSAWGSFIGFLAGTIMKLFVSLILGYYFIINAF